MGIKAANRLITLCITGSTHNLAELFPKFRGDCREENNWTLTRYRSLMVVDLKMGLPIPITRALTLRMKSRAGVPRVTV